MTRHQPSKLNITKRMLIIRLLVWATLLAAGVGTFAQDLTPETIELRQAFVGIRYELPLKNLLPAGAPPVTWRLLCDGTITGNEKLRCPGGVFLDEDTHQVLVVAPVGIELEDPNDASKGPKQSRY